MGRTLPLFEAAPPTTREVADAVRATGPGALDETARRRADAARYQEVSCRSALNRVRGKPFSWTLNPYRGCTHGCHYCYARRYHAQFELGAGDDFASVILVKTNLLPVLRKELARPAWRRETVALGTATDCYQPIEGHYRLTRGALEALLAARTPVDIVTKGPMVVRDIDLLQALGRAAGCTVYVSVPSVDEDVWRALEPGTAHPRRRLAAMGALAAAGVRTGVLMMPIVPGISSRPDRLERTVKAAAEHGAAFLASGVMRLEGGTRDHFLAVLDRDHPGLVDGYARLYAGTGPPAAYRRELQRRVAALTRRYGIMAG
jgi:DNA repair photolyase